MNRHAAHTHPSRQNKRTNVSPHEWKFHLQEATDSAPQTLARRHTITAGLLTSSMNKPPPNDAVIASIFGFVTLLAASRGDELNAGGAPGVPGSPYNCR